MEIELTENPHTSDMDVVKEGMRRYEISRLPDLADETEDQHIAAFARDEAGSVCGGILANVYWNGLEIDVLWVGEDFRHENIASRLVCAVEAFARGKGAVVAFLKTVDAKKFYESLGYTVFGELEDRPIGTVLYHLKKRLDQNI